MNESARIMFEIYRESGYNGRFRVVYFTELNEHNRETEINRAMAGDHVFDGFIPEQGKEPARQAIDRLLERMNAGEPVGDDLLRSSLAPFIG
jgi:hypothetical protein